MNDNYHLNPDSFISLFTTCQVTQDCMIGLSGEYFSTDCYTSLNFRSYHILKYDKRQLSSLTKKLMSCYK